ncbi:MAG TPA: nucleoside monophosphate kinase [Candidatus Saccharimonadia bacterium]|jgi:adenylate kinase
MGALIVLMGPTGAGKSVQGDLLSADLGGAHLSSGKLLRADAHAAAKLVDGRLAPADEVQRVVGEAMAKIPQDRLVVLDGTPRTDSDVHWLDENLPKLGRELSCVVLIELDIETSMKRLGLRGREDDAPEAVREKWQLFEDVTGPVVEHYRQLGLLVRVDGRGSIEEVHKLMKTAVSKVVSV